MATLSKTMVVDFTQYCNGSVCSWGFSGLLFVISVGIFLVSISSTHSQSLCLEEALSADDDNDYYCYYYCCDFVMSHLSLGSSFLNCLSDGFH